MRSRAALLAGGAVLVVAVATCAKPSGVATEGDEPSLRVALVAGGSEARVGGTGTVGAMVGGSVQFRLSRGEEVRITPDGRAVRVSGAASGRYERVTFVSLDRSRFVTVGGKPYRGVVEVYVSGGGVTAVNEVSTEAYLAGVINAEMGRRARGEEASSSSGLCQPSSTANHRSLQPTGQLAGGSQPIEIT